MSTISWQKDNGKMSKISQNSLEIIILLDNEEQMLLLVLWYTLRPLYGTSEYCFHIAVDPVLSLVC